MDETTLDAQDAKIHVGTETITGERPMVPRLLSRLFELPLRTAVWLASHVLVRPPAYESSPEQRRAFESLYEASLSSDSVIEYDLPHPMAAFLTYVASEKPVVFHGSNDAAIETFEPRTQTDWRGTEIEAVFATKDGILATFFAILDRDAGVQSLRNGGYLVETPTGGVCRRYFFSVSTDGTDRTESRPFTTGAVYLLPEEGFEPAEYTYLGFDEWYCERPVEPLATLRVDPSAFPFRRDVTEHDEDESMLRSMVLYRWRRRRRCGDE